MSCRDLLSLILSSVSGIKESKSIFQKWIRKLEPLEAIPENACSSIVSALSKYKDKQQAMEWIKRMQANNIPLRFVFFPLYQS